MIHRNIYRGFIAQGADMAPCLPELANEWKHSIESGLLYAASLFRWRDNLFLYYESPDESLAPETITASLGTALSAQPGTSIRRWTRMMDIFHYHESQDESHWQRSHPNPKATARVNRLKPEMYASYVFYHYQLQEEHPAIGDKYGIIGADENLLFFYQEEPKTVEPARHKGRLTTRNSPREDWQELMTQHFLPWEDGGEPWRLVDNLLQAFPGA